MKKLAFLSLAYLLLVLLACEPSPTNSSTSTTTAAVDTTTTNPLPPKQRPDCPLQGEVLEGNQHWFAAKDLLVCISADSTTFETGFGPSHRILQVWDTRECKQIHQQTLPVNNSPDYPYYLSEKLSDADATISCCQGFDFVFCYDLEARRPIPQLTPQWPNERPSVDAQSGLPMGLQLIGNHLLGYARDYGAFAFDLSDRQAPQPLLPAADYKIPQAEAYSSLFLLPAGRNTFEVVLPKVNTEGHIEFNHLNSAPIALNPILPPNVRNNRFIVLSDTNFQRIAIDMKEQKSVNLPAEIADKPVQKILKWLKSQ